MLGGLCINGFLFIAILFIILIGCLYEWYKMQKLISGTSTSVKLLLGSLYISLAIASMFFLGFVRKGEISDYSPLFPCSVIFSMWINDTMAYIVGSFIGKTPFSRISPKKTWEGTIGGGILCAAVITWFGSSLSISKYIPIIHWFFIGIICAVLGTLGDLLESKMKRMAGVKDSGTFLPGHGGFLDRFDSMLMAAPIIALYVYLFLY